MIPLYGIDAHRSVCLLEETPCHFATVGCNTKLSRQHMIAHEQKCLLDYGCNAGVAYDGEETALRIAVDKAIHIEKQKGISCIKVHA